MQAIEWEREPCLVLGTLGKMFGVLCEIDFLDETSLPRTAWLRTRVAPPLRRQFHEAVEQACRPLVRVITRRGVDVAAMSDDQHEWSPTFERSIRGITLASPLFCNARIPPPLSLVRLNALMATETMAEPSVSDTFFHCTLRALNIYCQHGDLSAFGTDAVLTSAILAGYTAYMDAMPSSTESDPPPFFQHAELLSLQRVCCDQASFGAALARSPALEVAEHATMVLQRTGCVNQTFLLGSIIGECWMYMSESALAGRVARGVVESVLRAILVVTDELAVEVGEPVPLSWAVLELPKQIRRLFASTAAPTILIDRLRPLLPGMLDRTIRHQLPSAYRPIQAQIAAAWSAAVEVHAGPDGRSSCANPACAVRATDATPMRVCGRCKWLAACSPACLRVVWPTHRQPCSILAMSVQRAAVAGG